MLPPELPLYYVLAEFESGEREWYGKLTFTEAKERIRLLSSQGITGHLVWGS